MLKISKLFSTVNDVGKMTSHTAEMPENPESLQSRSTTESIRSLVSRFDDVISISATIQNTGIVGGTEIVQLYMGYPKSFSEPLRQLKDIQVADLGPGESTNVTFVLTSQDLAVWDPNSHTWSIPCVHTADPNCDCRYAFFVGASSRDLRLNGTVIMM
jgi:Fibronectin type III-like domain